MAPLIAAATWSQYLELLQYIALLETCLPTYFNDRKFKIVKIYYLSQEFKLSIPEESKQEEIKEAIHSLVNLPMTTKLQYLDAMGNNVVLSS